MLFSAVLSVGDPINWFYLGEANQDQERANWEKYKNDVKLSFYDSHPLVRFSSQSLHKTVQAADIQAADISDNVNARALIENWRRENQNSSGTEKYSGAPT